jgi:hypothetical protein
MKHVVALVCLVAVATIVTPAQAGVGFNVGVGVPVYAPPVYAPPAYYAAPPAVYGPAPVYAAPAPVYVAPAPAYAPVVYGPRVGIYYGGWGGRWGYRGRWHR